MADRSGMSFKKCKYYFLGKILTDLNSQCENISKNNLGENFPQYLCPHLVKTCFMQSDQVISKALEYKVGRVLAPSIESDCCGFQNDISSLVIKLF